MTDILHCIGTEPTEKKQIENEQEAWRTVEERRANPYFEVLQNL
jgi:hypothetical protein